MHSEELKNQHIENSNKISLGEIIIGTLINVDSQGQPLVDFPENPENQPLVAVSTLSVSKQQNGRQVALLFANGNPKNPVIMGLIHNPLQELIENFEVSPIDNNDIEVWPQENTDTVHNEQKTELQTTIDGKRIVLEGKEEVVLRCGDASITLTKAGKIIIRGKYLLNRSSGVNRIEGGSVQIN